YDTSGGAGSGGCTPVSSGTMITSDGLSHSHLFVHLNETNVTETREEFYKIDVECEDSLGHIGENYAKFYIEFPDADSDGVIDADDICVNDYNPNQEDLEATINMKRIYDLSDDDDFVIGNNDALVEIASFMEFQCPFSSIFYNEIFPQIKENYIDTGKVRFVFRDFIVHPTSQKAQEAAQCANEQGKFIEYSDILYQNQENLEVNDLKDYAINLGLNMDIFNPCLDSGKYAIEVNKDTEDGKDAGVRGTPTFFINGKKVAGTQPYDKFETEIEAVLNGEQELPIDEEPFCNIFEDDDPIVGNASAPVTMVGFAEFQCQFSGRFYRETFPQIKENYIDTDKLKFVYRDFVIHLDSRIAQIAGECAHEQNKFWEYWEVLYDNQENLTVSDLKSYANFIGLDTGQFDLCLDLEKYGEEVDNDTECGRYHDVRGIPTFFINGKKIVGALPYSDFETEIEIALNGEKEDRKDPYIYGDKVVFQKNISGNKDIYMYDLTYDVEFQVTSHASKQYDPRIYENKIIWSDCRNSYNNCQGGNQSDTYLYDLSTATMEPITPFNGQQIWTAIYGDVIAYVDFGRHFHDEIYAYNLSTGIDMRITTTLQNPGKENPAIYKNKIVWADMRNGTFFNIYMYDLETETETQITNTAWHKWDPSIYENKIVWADYRNGNVADIYMYDLETETEIQITTDPANQAGPKIYKDKIVYTDGRNGNTDIYMYDLTNDVEIQISDGDGDEMHPNIYENKIVFWDANIAFRTGFREYDEFEIYVATVNYGDGIGDACDN
ncbi:MAG: thioredoxin domain-containing protein, partial [Candidatus Aenigmarchaeota archaeon]|nr:thioredoxin domain-containing protein [Candidatus Aenigmarchaeota archaeon]